MASRDRDQKTHANERIRDTGGLPWAIVYYLTSEGTAPALEFLGTCPSTIDAQFTGPRREQFRLFCVLENGTSEEIAKRGLPRPAIAVITGMRKPWRTAFSDRDYKRVRDFGTEHQRNYPRRLAT